MSYKPVIIGDASLAMRYKAEGRALLRECKRMKRKAMTSVYSDVIIIAKWTNGKPKVLFIAMNDLLIVYLEKWVGDILHFYGWAGTRTFELFTIDITDFGSPGTLAVEIPPLEANSSYAIVRDPSPAVTPPLGQYPLTWNGKRKITKGAFEALVYETSAFNFKEMFRGTDRDYFYTATITGASAQLHQRLWTEATIRLQFSFPVQNQIVYPAVQLDWPATTFETYFPKAFNTVNNKVYIVGTDNANLYVYNEVWEYDPAGPTFANLLVFDIFYAGGSSKRNFSCQLYNKFDTETGVALSEIDNAAGNPSDLELLVALDSSVTFSFTPSTTVSYTRDASNKNRISYIWKIKANYYGMLIQNISQPVTPSAQVPDLLLYVFDTGGTPTVTLAYQAPEGYGLQKPEVNPVRPNLLFIGEKIRYGTGTENVYMINMENGKKKTIVDDRFSLTSGRFVR